jgi:hypothetical protein
VRKGPWLVNYRNQGNASSMKFCGFTTTRRVRAEGLEPSNSLEHRHLKPACLPISSRPQGADRTARLSDKFVGGPTYLVPHGGEKGRTGAIREGVRSRTAPYRNRLERLCDRASDGHTAKDGVGLALLQVTNSSKGSERNISLRR